METTINQVTLNGKEYVLKSSIKTNQSADPLDGMPYVILRTQNAGVLAGYLKNRTGEEAILGNYILV